VTIDGHKQLFMPMGCGMLALRDPEMCKAVVKTASYIIRAGSLDLGKFTLEGSRPSNAVYMHANLACIGANGYETLINRSARVCRYMASALQDHPLFELVFEPMTNILLYRYVPKHLKERMHGAPGSSAMDDEAWQELDDSNAALQEQQKADGLTFVSRTTVWDVRHQRRLVALRIVIGNPITEERDIDAVLADQSRIVAGEPAAPEETEDCRDSSQQDYWRRYWERMPEAARVFFLDDMHRFRGSLVAPMEEPESA
jgi:glutamate decarboxylase